MKIGKMFNHSVIIMLMLVSVCCMIVLIISMFKLPDISTGKIHYSSKKMKGNSSKDVKLGKFGEMMIEMLPNDLAFTVFVPSEKAFERDLGLRVNHSFTPKDWDNAYATVSHVLGFSTIPRKISTDLLFVGKGLSYDSISGFILYIFKDFDEVLVVNRVRAEHVDIKRGDVVVHLMDGVIMDAEFQQSVKTDDI